MSDWIPIAKAKIDRGKRYEVTWERGSVSVELGCTIVPEAVLAVREYTPEPYVPPKPKRREWWIAGGESNGFAYRCPQYSGNVKIPQIHVREVLPGDPNPDLFSDIIEAMRERSSGFPILEEFADRLEGKA
jgi:hypothetical protein